MTFLPWAIHSINLMCEPSTHTFSVSFSFLPFLLPNPLSLSHLYPHISCSSTNKSCKVNVSAECLPYMKTNEQVHSILRLIFPPTEFFFSSTNFVLISQGRWIISSRTSSRIKAKEKMFKHLLLALPLTL